MIKNFFQLFNLKMLDLSGNRITCNTKQLFQDFLIKVNEVLVSLALFLSRNQITDCAVEAI